MSDDPLYEDMVFERIVREEPEMVEIDRMVMDDLDREDPPFDEEER